MLPTHQQRYQEFKQALEQLKAKVAETVLKQTDWLAEFLLVQQFFQQQIVNFSPDSLAEREPRVRSYQTEMSKQLRLLGVDLTFLQAARQPDTIHQRQRQISERLTTLIKYCDALLADAT